MATTNDLERRERLRRLASGDVLSQPTVDAARALLNERDALEADRDDARRTRDDRWQMAKDAKAAQYAAEGEAEALKQTLTEAHARIAALEAERKRATKYSMMWKWVASKYRGKVIRWATEHYPRLEVERDRWKTRTEMTGKSCAQAEREVAALKRELAEVVDQRDGARANRRAGDSECAATMRDLGRATEALRAARADLESAILAMRADFHAGCDCGACQWLGAYDDRSRPAPFSAAPTGPLAASTALCPACGTVYREDDCPTCAAPPAPEVPTAEVPHVHAWVTAHGGHHASCTSPDVRCCGWVAAKVCACGEALCSKHFACSPVALETHGLSHGDACPAGKEPR